MHESKVKKIKERNKIPQKSQGNILKKNHRLFFLIQEDREDSKRLKKGRKVLKKTQENTQNDLKKIMESFFLFKDRKKSRTCLPPPKMGKQRPPLYCKHTINTQTHTNAHTHTHIHLPAEHN